MPLTLPNRLLRSGITMIAALTLFVAPASIALFAQSNGSDSVLPAQMSFQEKDGLVVIEAEDFASQNADGPRRWHLTTAEKTPDVSADGDPNHASSAAGGAYLELLPDTRRDHGDKLIRGENFQQPPGPVGKINYRVHFKNTGRYYVWVRAFSTGSEDNGIHVGLDDTWPESGRRMQWCKGKNAWRWESMQRTKKEHCGVPGQIYLDIKNPGLHTVSFCMREDGFEFDRFLMIQDKNFQRPEDAGPAASITNGAPTPDASTKRQPNGSGKTTLSGEQKTWHKITLDVDGPFAHENDADANPFLDYRMTCTFVSTEPSTQKGTVRSTVRTHTVPGYFAADGNAAETSAAAGTTWRCHLTPDVVGHWTYKISFVKGKQIAIRPDDAGTPVEPYHGLTGQFDVTPTDKAGNDLRATGQLRYVGQHYLQAAETKRPFFKVGPDAPETMLAYQDFDGTIALSPKKNALKTWQPHVQDWRDGDPTWQDGKGRGLIGALNYLAEKNLNAFSFLTYNRGGDGDNVWPHVSGSDRLHFDCSKLDQWGIVIDHAQTKGLLAHVKLQETENDDRNLSNVKKTGDVPAALDGGELGVQRKVYLRELIARFGHAPGLEWNLGEENTQTTQQQNEMATYIQRLDSYDHLVVLHTYPNAQDKVYQPLLGDQSTLTGVSLQNDWDQVHQRTLKWVQASAKAGNPWVCANDEQGKANQGVPPDPGYDGFDGTVTMKGGRTYDLHDIRKQTLWGNIMAGGGGVMYYFGYKLKQSDLHCEDFRSRDQSWDFCAHAVNFLREQNLPLTEMTNMNGLVGNPGNKYGPWCLAKPNAAYLLYLPEGGPAKLDLTNADGSYTVTAFNPRDPSVPSAASEVKLTGGGIQGFNTFGAKDGNDLVFVIRRSDRNNIKN